MANRKFKKFLCVTLAAMSLACMGLTASAGTIGFTVTVGGSGTQDPLSKREIKANDGDNFAYFTGVSFSQANAGIYVRSYNLKKEYIYSGEAFLTSSNAGKTKSTQYNMKAPGGEYYYMKSQAQSKRVTVTGRYCP